MNDAGRIAQLEQRTAEMERSLDEVIGVVSLLAQRGPSDEKPLGGSLDTVLVCRNCQRRIALYDPEKDEIRIRHKGLTVYFNAGPGGYVKLPCPHCGGENHMADDEKRSSGV